MKTKRKKNCSEKEKKQTKKNEKQRRNDGQNGATLNGPTDGQTDGGIIDGGWRKIGGNKRTGSINSNAVDRVATHAKIYEMSTEYIKACNFEQKD